MAGFHGAAPATPEAARLARADAVSPYLPPGLERVVVRAPNWLGDVVLSLAALRDLRRNLPAARIDVLARPRVAPLYGAVEAIDAVHTSHGFHADAERLAGRAPGSGPAYDLAVLLPNSFGSALVAAVAGVRERWGYATDGRGWLLTRAAPIPAGVRGRSQVYYYRAMLAGAGLNASLRCPAAWRDAARPLLTDEAPFWIGVCPGAHFGGAKRWLPERFGAVAEAVHRRTGAGVLVLGSAVERPVAEAVAAATRAPCRVLCGETSLEQLVGVLAQVRLLLTNDSGPMHVAAALGTPLVAVFGSTDWRETAPVGQSHRLVREDVDCAPCLLRECPIDHRCMTRVDAERVSAAALELLAEPSEAAR
jgi:heptosyltransferase-2